MNFFTLRNSRHFIRFPGETRSLTRLSLALLCALSLLIARSNLIKAQVRVPVSIVCNSDGTLCTVTSKNYRTLVEKFDKSRTGSCQAAINLILGGISFPAGLVPVYTLTCRGSGSASESESYKPAQSAAWSNNNCCYDYWQCRTDQEWQEGYWAFQNGQCAAGPTPALSSPASTIASSSSEIDNCCFVDRQCASDQEWIDGYYAYQNGQCAAGGQSQTPASSPISPLAASSTPIDNCCFVDRQCTTDHEWVDGYYAYQNGHCGPLS